MRSTALNSSWTFKMVEEPIGFLQPNVQFQPWMEAQVPGHVHDDLVANGVIAPPFERQYELGCRWVDLAAWHYKTTFEWKADASLPRRVLQFEGLDTVAEVVLNGKSIAKHDNMFVGFEVDVTESLSSGTNELEIIFQSAVKVGIERRKEYFEAEGLDWANDRFDERAFVRKAGYMSSWDWGPRLVSCGIWRPVHLLEFSNRLKSVYWKQEKLEDGRFRLTPEIDLEGDGIVTHVFDPELQVEEIGSSFIVSGSLWWPAGEGEAKLYAITSNFGDQKITQKIGLRTIRLSREPDAVGESFEFIVNGRPVWIRGANWIPNDSFPSRVTDQEYHDQVVKCRKLNMNMLRVWGGGLYEMDGFYEACDEQGILVWQDFTYGCSYYPDGPAAQEVAKEEAEYNVKRLRGHASLALWCGNNENLTMWEDKWGEVSPPRYYGENIYNIVLPEVVSKLNPETSYIPSSPCGSAPADKVSNYSKVGANMNDYGDQHYWDVWHGLGDWHHYSASHGRFSSEFGFASSCSMAIWSKTIAHKEMDPKDLAVIWHDKTGKGTATFRGYVEMHYPHSETLDNWVYYSQLNQRDALKFGIEHYRFEPNCRGSLIWQFNDCWPVECWAVQDYLRLLKPGGHELYRLYADVVATAKVDGDALVISVVNSGSETLNKALDIAFYDTVDGSLLNAQNYSVTLAKGEIKEISRIDTGQFSVDQTAYSLLIEGDKSYGRWNLLGEPKETKFGEVKISATAGETLEVTVEGYVHDLVVWDMDDAFAIGSSVTGQSGWEAVSGANTTFTFEIHRPIGTLKARSLAGEHEVLVQGTSKLDSALSM